MPAIGAGAAARGAASGAASKSKAQKKPAPKKVTKIKKENLPHQFWVRKKYESNIIQYIVAFLIFGNFFISATEAQLLPTKGSTTEFVFLVFEYVFGVLFTVELAMNMYGAWLCDFWLDAWNVFDFAIVLISLLSLALENLPGIGVLRLFRAFRVFRLFKRVPSLKLIIEGVLASMPGVANAFVVLTILMGVWSIMGVEFFGELNPQHFGKFMPAMLTMFQLMTMDSWASSIAREIIYEQSDPMAAVFFTSYIFVAGIVMTNVVVAILLEKYLQATAKYDNEVLEEAIEAEEKALRKEEEALNESLAAMRASAMPSMMHGVDDDHVPFADPLDMGLLEVADTRIEIEISKSHNKSKSRGEAEDNTYDTAIYSKLCTHSLVKAIAVSANEEAMSHIEREQILSLAQMLWNHKTTSQVMRKMVVCFHNASSGDELGPPANPQFLHQSSSSAMGHSTF